MTRHAYEIDGSRKPTPSLLPKPEAGWFTELLRRRLAQDAAEPRTLGPFGKPLGDAQKMPATTTTKAPSFRRATG